MELYDIENFILKWQHLGGHASTFENGWWRYYVTSFAVFKKPYYEPRGYLIIPESEEFERKEILELNREDEIEDIEKLKTELYEIKAFENISFETEEFVRFNNNIFIRNDIFEVFDSAWPVYYFYHPDSKTVYVFEEGWEGQELVGFCKPLDPDYVYMKIGVRVQHE